MTAERTDRELLELAAKASGEWPESWRDSEGYFTGVLSRWNPLEKDGDALRLAVNLRIDIKNNHKGAETMNGGFYESYDECGADKYAATRRAIVRAASQISLGMENHNGMA